MWSGNKINHETCEEDDDKIVDLKNVRSIVMHFSFEENHEIQVPTFKNSRENVHV